MFESVPLNHTEWMPLFPLPSAVLFPRAVLPLHVFEERYRVMTREALSGSRMIAIALLKPGHECSYHTLEAPIHDVVCTGRILREECLMDGRYNFLLQGVARAKVIEEDRSGPYRRARLVRLPVRDVEPQQECEIRGKLRSFLTSGSFATFAESGNWQAVLKCPDMSLSEQVDVLASIVLQGPTEKQGFLSEPGLQARSDWLLDALQGVAAALDCRSERLQRGRRWPPALFEN